MIYGILKHANVLQCSLDFNRLVYYTNFSEIVTIRIRSLTLLSYLIANNNWVTHLLVIRVVL
jgi:hypothetical protein